MNIISILGFLISLISIAIHIINFRYVLPRMKFEIQSNSFYCTAEDFKVKNFDSKYFAIISVKISNLSLHPITIDDAYLNEYVLNNSHFNSIKFEVLEIPNPKPFKFLKVGETHSYSIIPYESATLPMRINGFDTVLCSFKMSFDKDINRKHHTLFISTPRKVYKVPLSLKEYRSLIDEEMKDLFE